MAALSPGSDNSSWFLRLVCQTLVCTLKSGFLSNHANRIIPELVPENLRCELAQKFRITADITCRTPQRDVAEIEFISVVRHVHAGRRALLDDDYRNFIGELNQAVSSITPIQTPSVGSSSSSSFGFPNSARRSPGPYALRPKASHPADRSGVRPVEEACKLLGPSARLRVTGFRSYRLPAAGGLGTAYMWRRCRLLLLSGSLQCQLRNYRRAATAVFTSCAARKGRNKRERAAAVVFAMSVTVRLSMPPGSRPHSYLRPSWHNPRPAG